MKIPVLSIMFIIILILFFVGNVMSHEQVHKEIYRSYHINSTIHYSFFKGVTIADKPCPNEYCTMAHNYNEIISYNLDFLYWMIGFGFWIIIFILELRFLIIDIEK